MARPKVTDVDFVDFLIATPRQATATEAQRTQPAGAAGPAAHDAYTRLLHRLEPDGEARWAEARPRLGVPVLDGSVLDKPYARKTELVRHPWSGKHRAVVKGIGLLTLLWTRGDRHLPCDYRVYDRAADGKTKNDHFRDLLTAARDRKFAPEHVLFDGWYSGSENLKQCRALGWRWLTRLKSDRRVNPGGTGLRAVADCEIAGAGTAVHLEGYGPVKVFRVRAKDGSAEHRATDDLRIDDLGRLRGSRRTTGGSNRRRTSSGASAGPAGPGGATSDWPCGRSWSSGTASGPGSTG